MSEFDPNVPLVMAKFKTVHGFNLAVGTPLVISETPTAAGEVTSAMAARLAASGIAVPADDFRPTPVETVDQEKARLAAAALADAVVEQPGPDGTLVTTDEDVIAPDDLLVWQEDDDALGKKAGQKVTNADLVAIAEREGAVIETDDNKPTLIRKIVEHRASKVVTD